MNPQLKIKTLNNFISVKRITPTRQGAIEILENHFQSFYGVITSIGNNVKNKALKINSLVFCGINGKIPIKNSNINIFKEEDIYMIFKNKIWRPLGKRLLLQRLTEEFTIGSIIIPACRRQTDQTLDCQFILNGIDNDETIYDSGFNLVAGDHVKLKSWDKDIREVEIDGKFFIIVKPSHILYKSNNYDSSDRIIN